MTKTDQGYIHSNLVISIMSFCCSLQILIDDKGIHMWPCDKLTAGYREDLITYLQLSLQDKLKKDKQTMTNMEVTA